MIVFQVIDLPYRVTAYVKQEAGNESIRHMFEAPMAKPGNNVYIAWSGYC